MGKKFIDLSGGEFCGHYFKHDVYIQGLTIHARHGNDDSESVKCLIPELRYQAKCVRSLDQGDREPLTFTGSPRAGDREMFVKAMISALMFRELNERERVL